MNTFVAFAYAPFHGENGPGFSLPLFKDSTPNAIYLQNIDEITGKIVRFDRLRDPPDVSFTLNTPHPTRVNESALLVFMDDFGEVRVGSTSELFTVLSGYAERNPQDSATRLQIAEIIGSPKERASARARMTQELERHVGKSTADAFYASGLRRRVWEELIRMAPSRLAAEAVLTVRAQLSAELTSNGSIHIDLSALHATNAYDADTDSILDAIKQEFAIQPHDNEPHNELHYIHASRYLTHGSTIESARFISERSKQEERISLVLLLYVLNPERAQETVSHIGRLAVFEARALGIFDEIFHDMYNDRKSREDTLFTMVTLLFNTIFPMNRGALLFFLAAYLGGFGSANAAIRKCLGRTKSSFVEPFREEIHTMLNSASIWQS